MLLGSTLTDSTGAYEFQAIDPAGNYFYIAASMTGPLSGMMPSPGFSIVSALQDGTDEWVQFDLGVE